MLPVWGGRGQAHRAHRWAVLVVLIGTLLPLHARAEGDGWTKQLDATISSVASSADGSLVIVGSRDNRLVAVGDAAQPRWEFQTQGTVLGVAVSDDGQSVVAASEDRYVYALDGLGQQRWKYRGPQTFTSVAISKDGGVVAAGSEDRQGYLFDRDGTLRWTFAAEDAVTAMAIYGSAQAFRVLIGTRDSRVRLLSSDGTPLWEQQLDFAIRAISTLANGRRVIVGDQGNQVRLLDGVNGRSLWNYDAGSPVNTVTFSADGEFIAAGTQRGVIYVLRADGSVAQQQQVGADVKGLTITQGRSDLVLGNGSELAYILRSGDTYAFTRPTSPLLPIVSGGIVMLALIMTGLGARRTASRERAWRGYARRGAASGRRVWRARISYLFLLPTFILLLIFSYYPAISGIVHAFSVWNPGVETRWVGLQNFRMLAGDRYLWIGLLNAIKLILSDFLKLAIPLLVAELIFHLRSDLLRYVMRTLFVIPLILPGVVGILLWVNIYDPNLGLANQTLRALGLDHFTRVWLGDERTALGAIIFMGFPWISAFALLIFFGGLISIPAEVFDAAKVDGASSLRRFWSIDLPLLLGQIRLLLILSFIAGVQEFAAVFLTTGGGPGSATYLPSLELYYQAMRFNNFGLASAIGAGLFLIILAGTIFNLRYVKSAVEYTN